MKFGKFNKERLFTQDTAGFAYISIEEAAEKYGTDTEPIKLTGVYISNKSQFSDEAPIIATEEEYINLPMHQLSEVKEILTDKAAIRAINSGEAGVYFTTYFQKRFQRTCYKVVWADYDEQP